jgi:hypothetical protein
LFFLPKLVDVYIVFRAAPIDQLNSKISENDEGEDERRNGEAALASKNYRVVRC